MVTLICNQKVMFYFTFGTGCRLLGVINADFGSCFISVVSFRACKVFFGRETRLIAIGTSESDPLMITN